jgi:ATP-dependent phosphofructokinase / diphosphate-dependent phosphofructokinase
MSTNPSRTIAMLVGGGPAPGLNGVINSVTLSARARGWRVLGVPKGFSMLMEGDVSGVRELTESDVAGIETRGGSILYTARANPTKRQEDLDAVVAALAKLEVTDLVTLGGDDTASSAVKVAATAGRDMRAVHVPKTIDNDLPLPLEAPTFGFETAKYWGAELLKNLLADAKTTSRWYLVTAMGRSAGHLAVAMAVGSGSHLVSIQEEFPPGQITLSDIADLVEAAIVKRMAQGEGWGLAVLAEGLLDQMDPEEMSKYVTEYDEHGHPRLSEIDLGRVVRDVVAERLKARGVKMAFITKIIGYELRCADPVAFDVQYTRTLGFGAVEFLENGSGNALISLQAGKLVPIPFDELRDPETGKVRVRRVDVDGGTWRAALALQARLRPDDLEGPGLEALAAAAKEDPADLAARLGHLAGGA